jgi:hypothetical protein
VGHHPIQLPVGVRAQIRASDPTGPGDPDLA